MKYLIIGPGGMAYYALLGKLLKLHEDKELDDLEEISGSSAGSLCAFCYLISRGNIKQLVDISLHMNTASIFKFNIKNIIKYYGGINMKHARNSLSEVCNLALGISDVTFEELYKITKIKLFIPAYSLTKQTNEYFSIDSHPSFSVLDAVCASMSVPLMMSPYNNEYLDGSIIEEIPYIPFLLKDTKDVLVIKMKYSSYEINETKGLFGYIQKLVNILYSLRHDNQLFDNRKFAIIPEDINIYNFSMTKDTKMKLFLYGFK